MILSVSRRTDIPACYFDWFLNRLREGYALVRNPMNPRQVSRVELSPEVIDGIVFWTKNPAPMLGRLHPLDKYPYYIQFTINPYGRDLEAGLPDKADLVKTFRRLSESIGPERMVWRFSPIVINEKYTEDYLIKSFQRLSADLENFTKRCNLSFLDIYGKIKKPMAALGVFDPPDEQKQRLADAFFEAAGNHGISVGLCGNPSPDSLGLEPATCIDRRLIERIIGQSTNLKKDPGQRAECYCAQSIDIGAYDTCTNGCLYCYANHSQSLARQRLQQHDPHSPLLFGTLNPQDVVTSRAMKSCRKESGLLF